MNSGSWVVAPSPGRSAFTSALRPLRFNIVAGGFAAHTWPSSLAPTPAKPNSTRPRRRSCELHVHATGVPLSIAREAGKLLSRNVTGV